MANGRLSAAAVGVASWELDVRGPATLVRAGELGFESVHVDLADLTWEGRAVRAHELDRLCTEADVSIVAMGVNALNALDVRGDGREARRVVEQAVEAAATLRIPLLHLPAFRAAAVRTQDDVERTAGLLRLARDAANGLVTIATENDLPADACARLLRATDRDDVVVLFDSLNPIVAGHDPVAICRTFAHRLAPVAHVKDGTPGRKGDARIGAGAGRVDDSLRALGRIDAELVLVLENDYATDAEARTASDLTALRHLVTQLDE